MRRGAVVVTALFALIFAGDVVAWTLATDRLAAGIADLAAQLRTEGWQVRARPPVKGGWPFAARITIDDPDVQGGQRIVPGGLAWHADRIVASLSLFHPATLRVLPEGRQRVRLSHAPPVVFSADRLEAVVALDRSRPGRIDCAAYSLIGGLAASQHQQDVRLGTLSFSVEGPRPDATGAASPRPSPVSLAIRLQAEQLELPDTGRWPLGGRITRFGVSAALLSPPLSGDGADDQARAWRDGGGTLTLSDIGLRWGPLALQGTASLGLDSRLQPSGSGRARIAGWAAALDALAGGGAISPGLAATAKAVLGLMAVQGGGDGLDVPLLLRDSTLSAGRIPLVRLADIVWRRP